MADATAQLSNYRGSPRKTGLIADLVRGRRVSDVLASLDIMPKRAAAPLAKLIRSAVSNAKGLSPEELYVSKIEVGQGIVFRRSVPRARGSSAIIRKKSSHIKLELTRAAEPKKKAPKAKGAAKKEVKENTPEAK